MPKFIISLTTIPTRFGKIGPTLRDLLAQDVKVDEIRLNLARHYRRFPGEVISVPDLPEGVTVHWSDVDYGPATKVLPTVRDHRCEDVDILFCDDDQPYDRGWAGRFLAARRDHPEAAIAGQGYDLTSRKPGHRYDRSFERFPRAQKRVKGPGYRLWRTLTLTMHKPQGYVEEGYVDVLEGYRGALVRPAFFGPEVYEIPDVLWTVDDPWLSGHLESRGVPIWFMISGQTARRPYGAHFSDRLSKFVYRDHGRLEADSACINYYRARIHIWPGRMELPEEAPKVSLRHFFGAQVPFTVTEEG
ncbi:MAG: hypothetical protein CVT82_05080 [Alphaproteobacteria bacterium HGW-Alphaproteobacteria-4]|jgi:hypothetical protein|nr:MAG: hypothetical protein CVT82_05080 [Alphaproteobacteria bacterium HGW-Alphaproteobacteria-4]